MCKAITNTILFVASGCLLLIALVTLSGFFSQYNVYFDVASDFCVQYAIVLAVIAVIFALLKNRILLFLAITFLLLNLSNIAPLYFGPSPSERYEQAGQQRLSLLYMNVNYGNNQYFYSIDLVHRLNPDILVVSELTQAWADQLQSNLPEYQYGSISPREDAFGIALLSKVPLKQSEVKSWGQYQLPSIVATIDYAGKPVTLLATHPVPPVSAELFEARNEELDAILKHQDEFNKSLIVLADLNTTSWSYTFQKFQRQLGLLDTRQGFGIQQSWPDAYVPSIWNLLWITLDHVLVTPDWITLERRVGPQIGSDHLPVYVELAQKR